MAEPQTDSPLSSAAPASDLQGGNTETALHLLRRETVGWWLRLFIQPIALLLGIVALLSGLGFLQQWGLLAGSSHQHTETEHSATAAASYLCPMLCTPPLKAPGRCPVCDMELVPATNSHRNRGDQTIDIGIAARRIANIQTVAAVRRPAVRRIRSVGSLQYDEGTLKSITAWVDGRIEKLTADYTGVVIQQGEPVAEIYSPQLYTAQAELLLAMENSGSPLPGSLVNSGRQLYESARQRARELGMTDAQLDAVEAAGQADSRLQLIAPVSGTVIEKQVVEGQYVREGQQICRLADLSTVWLKLQLFPEDATLVRYGQLVTAEVQSLPGQKIQGRVAFIDPVVDPLTRTVGIRVVIPNSDGRLKIGDFATATVDVPLTDATAPMFDPELAHRWISPRHPQITSSEPGLCPICGLELVPASQLGFTAEQQDTNGVIIVPEDSVLMAGEYSLVYVEIAPGRFETRQITPGPRTDQGIVILTGLEADELVATRGNFLIDSQMQLAGNPSLIDPEHARSFFEPGFSDSQMAALKQLSESDLRLAEQQQICPVTRMKLGAMGTPLAVSVSDRRVLLCCRGCVEPLNEDPQSLLSRLPQNQQQLDQPGRNPAALEHTATQQSGSDNSAGQVPPPQDADSAVQSEPQQ